VENHEQPELGKTNLELMKNYEGICIGNKEKKYVYLTFDEGYEAGYTEKILDTLKEEKVQAVFFVTAHYINTAGDIVQRMIDERAHTTVIIL
jgi:peptidoglycan-N-acetylmuramic acid deacetylase